MNKMPARDFKQALKQYVRFSVVTSESTVLHCSLGVFFALWKWMFLIPYLYSNMSKGNNEQ